MKHTFVFDAERGVLVPRTRRIEAPRLRVCSGIAHHGLMMGGSAQTVAEAVAIYNGLVGWWSMDNNLATSTIPDSHSNAYNAALVGGNTTGTYSSATAKYGRSMQMTNAGGGNAPRVPRSVSALDFSGAVSMTIGLWFRFSAYSSFSGGFAIPIMGRWGVYHLTNTRNSASPTWQFGVRNSANSASGSVTAAASTTPTNVWYFLIGVHDTTNSQLRLYVNNVKTTTSSYTGGVWAGSTQNFGWFQQVTSDTTITDTSRAQDNTLYEEAFCCNVALTDAQVNYLYNGAAGRSYAAVKADAGH
ncbi:MAG: hypothetical protein ACSLE9_00735 [Burkholderiaceae bacterium]